MCVRIGVREIGLRERDKCERGVRERGMYERGLCDVCAREVRGEREEVRERARVVYLRCLRALD